MTNPSIAPNRTGRRASPASLPPLAAPGCGPPDAAAAAARLVRALALGVGAPLLLAGCAMFGGGRGEKIPDLAPIEALAAVETPWSTDTGSGTGREWLVLTPAVDAGRVYVADARGRVTAWDAGSGRSVWRADTDAEITGGVGAGGGLVLAGTEDGEVIALHAETGAVAWRTQLSSEVQSRPRVAGDRVVARTLDGKLVGLDAASGEVRWSYDGGVPTLSVRGTAAPAVVGGVTIAGFDNGRITAVRSATGEILWEAAVSDPRGTSELERLADVDTEAVVEGGVVYAASYERAVAAFDAETGRPLWRRDIASRSGLAADGDLLYVADTGGSVQALDRVSGAGVWTQASLAGRGPAWPVVHGAYVAVTDVEGYVHWLRREDGRPAARTRSGAGQLAGPPARHDDALIAYWGGGRLTAFRVR
jgi:outer membrane protein assembly factor BamB